MIYFQGGKEFCLGMEVSVPEKMVFGWGKMGYLPPMKQIFRGKKLFLQLLQQTC